MQGVNHKLIPIFADVIAPDPEIASLIDAEAHRHRLLRGMSLAFIQFWINVDRGGKRTNFTIPDSLKTYWDLPDEVEPSVWERLGDWISGRDRDDASEDADA